MKKIFAVILSISLIMGLAACAGKVEVPSKKDVQKEVEKEYDMDFDLDSKDIAEDGSEAEWVFISEDRSPGVRTIRMSLISTIRSLM